MTIPTSQPSPSRGRLRRFVAWSLFAHLGAGIAWGVPALLTRQAEQERLQEEAANAKHLLIEEAKAKEYARQQQIEATRREVERELRKEFDKLASALSEAKREELWQEVAKRTAAESANLAEALGKASTPEQDLRTLEAELQRAMVKNLDEVVTAESARELADRFVDQVESQVAPGLAETMKDELSKRVAQKMREEADRLIAKQREDAKRAADQTKGALSEAAAKLAAANAAATQAAAQQAKVDTAAQTASAAAKQLEQATASLGEAKARTQAAETEAKAANPDGKVPAATQAANKAATQAATQAVAQAESQLAKAKTESATQAANAAQQLEQATARLGEAESRLDEAGAKAASLDGKAQEQVAASDKAIADARAATAKAATAVRERSPDAATAVAEAKAATSAAQAATKSAIEAVAGQADRTAVASTAIRAAVEADLSAQVERALGDELATTTLPRLAGKLQEGFKKQLDANGMGDDALVAQVGKEVQERLAKAVPAMAKAGDAAVDARFSDLPAASAGTEGAAKPSPGDSLLDKALAEGLASMGENATKRVGEVAANASRDAALVDKATRAMSDSTSKQSAGTPAADAAAQAADRAALSELRDSVGALARSAGNGRISSNPAFAANVSALREATLARGKGRGAVRDEAAYQEITGQIAGRDGVQGERWTRQGAHGAVAQATGPEGDRPARVVGSAVGEGKPALANDQAYVPTFKTLAFATLPYCTASFRIDGKLEKWDALPAIELKPEHGRDRSKQVMKLAWSNAGVFIYCRITDPNRRIDKAEPGNFWESDSLELWMDAFNSKEKYRTRHIGQQFWLWPAGSASDPTLTGGEAVSLGKKSGFRNVGLRAEQLERWATQTAEGWVLEARIPPALINNADLAAGRILGFNIYVNTMGGTDWYWSAGDKVSTSLQPDTWGDLLLAGSDGAVEVLCGDGDRAKTVLAVGEPLRLRVGDSDMDLDPTARDKVMVTIKAHGGQQIAVLEETGGSTGVFEGAVSTALALDQPVPAVLSVYEGERVSIVYTDQARANGAREALLSTSVVFGSAVMGTAPTAKR